MSITHHPRLSVQGIREYEEAHRPSSEINIGDVERWASTIGGTLLVAHGLRRGSFGGLALAVLGGSLIYRGTTGHCQAYKALNLDTSDKHHAAEQDHIHTGRLIKQSVIVDRPADELYAFWREPSNGPRFMQNIESVTRTGERTSHWVARGPLGKTFAWDSEIINEVPRRLFAWKSLPGGDISNAGSVRFEPATGGPGTVVTLEVNYEPPAGLLGVAIAKILGADPDARVREDLGNFKQLMETGSIGTVEGQPSGHASRLMGG